ncbi:hypothetical protein M1M34_gp117 [Haloarcula tailed virus 2]|uniref:Uncharacterized protein n=1 Tax=Haloarcula tailed virus 2 TaxID=2877989 RepID=A0AAE9BZH7_9CAUD|nr:hypothetical protein M1M34_gp117 [Haloarcula tailed virus 2]UBF23216.1 hypothetical protein HATV-2_gp65 [Haloarcula tailed virus 2]
MEIEQIEEAVREIGAKQGGEYGLNSLLTKLGQYSSISVREDSMEREQYEEAMSDALAGLVMIISHMAVEEDVDLDGALEQRTESILDDVRERRESRENINAALQDGDYKKTAELMGFVDDKEDDSEQRFFQ